MRRPVFTSDAGFTFIAALFLVVILGIMMGAAGQSWRTIIQREKEQELLFRGGQILDAIGRWRKPPPGQKTAAAKPLMELKYLLEDPNSQQKVRYLRRLYKDPITNKDFEVIKDPTLGIIGVASSSAEKPFKTDFRDMSFQNMSGVYKTFDKKEKYSDWKFVPRDLQNRIPSQVNVPIQPIGMN